MVKQEVLPFSFLFPDQPLTLRVGPADRSSRPRVEGVTTGVWCSYSRKHCSEMITAQIRDH